MGRKSACATSVASCKSVNPIGRSVVNGCKGNGLYTFLFGAGVLQDPGRVIVAAVDVECLCWVIQGAENGATVAR